MKQKKPKKKHFIKIEDILINFEMIKTKTVYNILVNEIVKPPTVTEFWKK